MKATMSRLLATIVSLAALVGVTVIDQGTALAACNGAGYLCFYDYGTSDWGSVDGNNNYWGTFGWNDRADYFVNYGRSCSVRVYQNINGGGAGYAIVRGGTLTWPNIVSSNYWC